MIEQWLIAFCGISTLFLTTSLDYKWRRLASPIGLMAQPAWLYTSIANEQWGIAVLTSVYAFRWLQVFIRDWVKRKGP
jgi:hypothetical protein